jgi:hypothetical protein
MVISAGYIIMALTIIPLGFLNLQDNVQLQYVSFWLSVCVIAEFFWHFSTKVWHFEETPTFGSNQSQLVGIMIFSFAFTTAVPSWYVDKASTVGTNTVLWLATFITACVYQCMGLLAAWAYPGIRTDNVLNTMSNPHSDILTKICVSLFALGTVAPSIAVRSIMLRRNLCNESEEDNESRGRSESDDIDEEQPLKLWARGDSETRDTKSSHDPMAFGRSLASWFTCAMPWSMFWGVVFPWLCSFLFYEGDGFAHLINWTSLTINSAICYVVPLLTFIKAQSLKEKYLHRHHDYHESQSLLYSHVLQSSEYNSESSKSDNDNHDTIPKPVALPWIETGSHVPSMIAMVILIITVTMLIAQIGVNIFLIGFARQGLLD